MSYLDRYLSSQPEPTTNEAVYKLVAMASLYLSAKLHSTKKISASSIAALSRCFRTDQILKMETCLIMALSWHLHPPTPSLFHAVAHPLVVASGLKAPHGILELARYLAELSTCDSFFVDKKPSSVAWASLQVALEVTSQSGDVESTLSCLLEVDRAEAELCAERLHRVYRLSVGAQSGGDGAHARNGPSPTSVVPAAA